MQPLHSLSFHLVCKRIGWSRYYGAINTGNRQYIQRLWPILTKVAKFITEKYGMNASGFGVPRTPHTTGRPGEWVPANWYDEVNFGGFDAIVGVYSVQALEAMARLARWTSRPSSEIEQFERLVTKARVKYVSVYWDEASGWFGEWRDLDGKLRSTGYTWPNFVAMQELANISEPARRVRTLAAIDENYARIRRDYNVSKEGQWCTPDNLKQLAPHDCHGSCGKWCANPSMTLCYLISLSPSMCVLQAWLRARALFLMDDWLGDLYAGSAGRPGWCIRALSKAPRWEGKQLLSVPHDALLATECWLGKVREPQAWWR